MHIRVNGNTETVTPPCSIADLVAAKGLNGDGLVIEHNLRIIKKAHWGTVLLKEDDTLELLNFVGGG